MKVLLTGAIGFIGRQTNMMVMYPLPAWHFVGRLMISNTSKVCRVASASTIRCFL